MSLFSKLFGGGSTPSDPGAQPQTHQGFTITPNPAKEGGGWRIGATIEKDGKTHTLIRADVIADRDQAIAASLGKARQLIARQREGLFG